MLATIEILKGEKWVMVWNIAGADDMVERCIAERLDELRGEGESEFRVLRKNGDFWT